ncbi:MAG: DUF4349 domain-containing protein [Solirubrobacterales bacterium]
MESFRDDNESIAELRAMRPEPSQEFAADLDERAAAGFPRRSSRSASPLGRAVDRLRALKPSRVLIPAGATALTAIAVATVVVAVNEPETNSDRMARLSALDGPALQGSSGVRGEAAVPPVPEGAPAASGDMPSSSASGAAIEPARPGVGPFAAKAGRRDVERSAQLVLGADPAEVSSAAAQVFDAVHAVDGIVLSSSVSGGTAGDAGARFDLLIPAAKLGDALADFSAIAEVRSRQEATADITAPTVRTGELLRDSRAKIESLLSELSAADTEAERTAAEAELRAERRHNAYLRSQLSALERRANFSRVSLRIETGPAATPEDGSGWTIGDALDDAGHILGIAAGVTIVGLAILGPLALIALLAWLANRARVRRGRERALA